MTCGTHWTTAPLSPEPEVPPSDRRPDARRAVRHAVLGDGGALLAGRRRLLRAAGVRAPAGRRPIPAPGRRGCPGRGTRLGDRDGLGATGRRAGPPLGPD